MKTITPPKSPAKTKTVSTKKSATSKLKTTVASRQKEVATVAPATSKPTVNTPYQLQKRVMLFAVSTRSFVEKLPKQLAISEDARQLIRSSGELGANAISADESPSKKAFVTNMKFCRKNIKEVLYWLQLIDRSLAGYAERRRQELYKEAHELRRIFTAIVKTASKNDTK